MTDLDAVLELLNGSAVVPGLICLVLLIHYLFKEQHRRGLRVRDMIKKMPVGMDFVLAISIFSTAVLGERFVKWVWRRFLDAGDLGRIGTIGMILFGAGIIIGSLCKIRALTRPDYGNGPWLASTVATMIWVGGLMYFR